LQDQAIAGTTNLLNACRTGSARRPNRRIAGFALQPEDWESFATKYEKQDDGSLLGGGDIQPGDGLRIVMQTDLTNITALRWTL
jgi:hypothetical protein